jgi:hypothetical protein
VPYAFQLTVDALAEQRDFLSESIAYAYETKSTLKIFVKDPMSQNAVWQKPVASQSADYEQLCHNVTTN